MFHAPFRKIFVATSVLGIAGTEALASVFPPARLAYLFWVPFVALGVEDMVQTKQAIRRNYPILGRGRYLMEAIRPEINQYFVESDVDGRPFNRDIRSNIYQRAKKQLNTRPFGTKLNVYEEGYEWINHSLRPIALGHQQPRVTVGEANCSQPYSASIFNISAMSYGSLSKNAILALNEGAKMGGFAHNTGEGGLSPHHLAPGGDIIWQIGTGYFGCRNAHGDFDADKFTARATLPNVKMIEVKLSQGAKPGHGGILPKEKITPEIVAIREVVPGQDVLSPPYHTAFSTPKELLMFLSELRALSGGKPVGFKLCIGQRHEFLAICKAMLETGLTPDFITVDGSEGGTGAAPIEFSDSVGTPLNEGLVFVHNALTGINLRDKIRIIASGKVSTAFHLISKIAMGADMCNCARGMMFALGCIQALQCHANTCPTGVATQDPDLVKGLVVEHKSKRVTHYHAHTLELFNEILGAAGLTRPSELNPNLIYRRLGDGQVKTYSELYEYLEAGSLLLDTIPEAFRKDWEAASPETFAFIDRTVKI